MRAILMELMELFRLKKGTSSSPRCVPAAVLAFSEVMAEASSLGKYALALHDTGRAMRLDAAAQRALNVLPQRTDANESFSLYGLLNKGRTTMGRRLLKVRVLCFLLV